MVTGLKSFQEWFQGYEQQNKNTGLPQFYRFSHPRNQEYPFMIELLVRRMEAVILPEGAILTPLPIDDDISSLSAILLNTEYYEFLLQGRIKIDGVTILDAGYLIPFKAKAWLDLTNRKSAGESIDSKNIRKHSGNITGYIFELIKRKHQIRNKSSVFAFSFSRSDRI